MAAPKYIKALFQHYLDNICTPDELDLLIGYFGTAEEQDLRELIIKALFEEDGKSALTPNHKKNVQLIYQNISQNIAENEPEHIDISFEGKRSLWPRIAAAAAVLLVIGFAIFFYTSYAPRHSGADRNLTLASDNIKPGGNKAILTLSDGSTINLDSAGKGAVAKQSGVQITKTANGQLIYEVSSSNDPASLAPSNHPVSLAPSGRGGEAGEGLNHSNNSSLPSGISPQRGERGMALNTIETPRGGQYQVRLPDGSKVWLNAASKLTYPVSFNGRGERRVELSGEAYFEVAKDKEHPFHVRTTGQEVEVLGTHFNMNAYPDEDAAKTSLLEGLVKVSKNGKSALLKPGQESIILSGKSAISVRNADVQAAVAWKNGLFSFKRAELKVVMRQIARWYDVEIVYQGDIPETAITGTIGRNLNASQALQIIGNLGISYKIEGKKVIINGK